MRWILLVVSGVLLTAPLGARLLQPAAASGVVFVDRNGNSTRDAGEEGIPGVAVSNQQQVATTAADGSYQLPSGGLGVVFMSVPDGYAAVGAFWRPAAARVEFALRPRPRRASFTFVHASDPHVSKDTLPRLQRVRKMVEESLKPDFVLVTGDLVRDALRVGEAEASGYYDLYTEEIRRFPVPVWSVPGNHENFGIERHLSLVSATHPLYGKGMYRARLGPNYYSFNYGGIHFVGLDSVDIEDLWYYGHIDATQLAWLRADLAAIPPGSPVVTFSHIPFVSAMDMVNGFRDEGAAPSLIRVRGRTLYRHVVSNFADVQKVLEPFNWTLALGGHLHIRETIRFESPTRTRFYQTAAVLGPTQAPVPAISGITVYTSRAGSIDDGTFHPLGGR